MTVKDLNAPKAKEVTNVVSKPEEKTYLQKVTEAREKAAEMDMINQVMGIQQGKGGGGADVQTAIVTAAQGQQKILFDALQQQIGEANKQLTEARTEREKAQTELYNERIITLKAEKEKLDDAAEAAKGAGAPRSELTIYKDVRKELQEEIDELAKKAPKVEGTQGMSAETMITLKKLELDQGKVLAEVQANAQAQQNAFLLKMKEFDEDAKRRWAEYRDSREFRQQGMDGFQDLVHAVGEGIAKDKEAGGVGAETKITGKGKKPAPAEEETHEAFITSFPCSQCEEKVPVDQEKGKGVCPGCGAEYEIRSKE